MKYPGKRMRCLIKLLGIIHNGLPGNCLNLMINLVTTSGRGRLVAIGGGLARATTEQAKVIVEVVLSFLLCQFPVFTEIVSKGIGRGGRQ